MNIKGIATVITGTVLAIVMSSCTTAKIDSWTSADFKNRPIGKVLVIGISANDTNRRIFEDIFTDELGKAGVNALTSYSLFPAKNKLTKTELNAALKKNAIDSIIITRITNEKDKVDVIESLPTAYGYYSMAWSPMMSPAMVHNYTEYHIEIKLFDAKSGKLVWSGKTVVTDDISDNTNMHRIINGAIKTLKKKRLLLPPQK